MTSVCCQAIRRDAIHNGADRFRILMAPIMHARVCVRHVAPERSIGLQAGRQVGDAIGSDVYGGHRLRLLPQRLRTSLCGQRWTRPTWRNQPRDLVSLILEDAAASVSLTAAADSDFALLLTVSRDLDRRATRLRALEAVDRGRVLWARMSRDEAVEDRAAVFDVELQRLSRQLDQAIERVFPAYLTFIRAQIAALLAATGYGGVQMTHSAGETYLHGLLDAAGATVLSSGADRERVGWSRTWGSSRLLRTFAQRQRSDPLDWAQTTLELVPRCLLAALLSDPWVRYVVIHADGVDLYR